MTIRLFIKTVLLLLCVIYILKPHLINFWTRISRCEIISLLEAKFSFLGLVFILGILSICFMLLNFWHSSFKLMEKWYLLIASYSGFSKAVVLKLFDFGTHEKLLKTSKRFCLLGLFLSIFTILEIKVETMLNNWLLIYLK